ncbi:hypothetical protein HOY80DRAFT_967813 [Tuber brumale]|nr:hypothetical protein HOY80DRAFT_967813 [Tuber brumale]
MFTLLIKFNLLQCSAACCSPDGSLRSDKLSLLSLTCLGGCVEFAVFLDCGFGERWAICPCLLFYFSFINS